MDDLKKRSPFGKNDGLKKCIMACKGYRTDVCKGVE